MLYSERMEINFMSLETKRKINQMAELCSYGIEWNRDLPDSSHPYTTGGIETVSFIISCYMVQWFGFECCAASDVRDFLKLNNAIEFDKPLSIKEWEKKLVSFMRYMLTCNE